MQRFSLWCLVVMAAAAAVSSAEVQKSKEGLSASASLLTHSLPPHAPPRPLVSPHGSPTPHPTLAPNYLHGPYAPPPNYHHLYSGKDFSLEVGRS